MALSKRQLAIVTTIKGKLRSLLMVNKKDDYTADKIIDHNMNKINSLIVTYDLSGEEDLLDEVYDTLITLKKNNLAWKFARKYNLLRRIRSGTVPFKQL
jgi:hypothetical protein